MTPFRTARTALTLALAAVLLVACAPDPSPTPTPSAPFATEEEAFAAAEETYRAYVDALNAVDLSDPDTFEGVYAWTTGELNASDRKGLTSYHADQLRLVGTSTIALLAPSELNSAERDVALDACLDVSNIDVVDAEGRSVVDPDRAGVQRIRVNLVDAPSSSTGLAISAIDAREDGPEC